MYSSLAEDSRQRSEAAAWHALALAKLQQFQKAWDTLAECRVNDPAHLQEGVLSHLQGSDTQKTYCRINMPWRWPSCSSSRRPGTLWLNAESMILHTSKLVHFCVIIDIHINHTWLHQQAMCGQAAVVPEGLGRDGEL